MSYVFIGGGFWMIAKGWRVLWNASRREALATTGLYAWVRHPQYVGFLAIMVGFLLQWPTLLMFPVLIVIYRRLAVSEERTVRASFGPAWDAYAAVTPRFIPRRRTRPSTPASTLPAGLGQGR